MKASSVGSDLYERQLAWARRRDEQMEEERAQVQRDREKECTFQPKVNPVPDSSGYTFSNSMRKEVSYEGHGAHGHDGGMQGSMIHRWLESHPDVAEDG